MDAEPPEFDCNHGPRRSRRRKFQTILTTTQAIGRASTILGVKAASDVATHTLEALKEVQSNKELCRLLATRITQILDILQTQTADFEEDSIPVSIATSVQQFTRDLNCVLSYVAQLSKQSAMHKFIRRNSIQRALEGFVTLVEDTRSNFLLSQLGEVIHARKTAEQIESSAVAVRRDGLRLVRRHELVLLGGFRGSDYQLVSVQGERKLAKQYRRLDETKYEVDLSIFKRMNHVSLPQVFGVAEGDMAPMILFHLPVSNRDLVSLLRGLFSRRELWKLQAMLLRMCHDLQAALTYLEEKHIKWSQSSVTSPSNMFVINENEHFVLTGGLFTNQGEQPDQRGLQFHTVVAVKDSLNSATAVSRGHVDVLSRKLLDWIFLTERPFEPCHVGRARYSFPSMTVDDVLVQPSCTLRNYSTSWLGATSFTSSIPRQPGDILLVLNYAIPDIEDRDACLLVKLCNVLTYFGGIPSWLLIRWRCEVLPYRLKQSRTHPMVFNGKPAPYYQAGVHCEVGDVTTSLSTRRSLFQGVRIISRHMRRKQSIPHTQEAYSRFCGIVAQIARFFGVSIDELALVTDCTAHIRYNAFFNRRKDRCLSAPDIYLFEPQDLSYMPYWSFLPDPNNAHTPLGASGSAVRKWRASGFSTECWIEKYDIGLMHLELGDIGSSSVSSHAVNLNDVMVDVTEEFCVSRGPSSNDCRAPITPCDSH